MVEVQARPGIFAAHALVHRSLQSFLHRSTLLIDSEPARRANNVISKVLMIVDMCSDYVVVVWLHSTRNPLFSVGLFLCLASWAIVGAVLLRPLFRLQARSGLFGKRGIPWLVFVPLWAMCAIPAVATIDVVLFTWFLFSDPEEHAQLIFYLRLRMLVEVVFESIPQALFQMSLFRESPLIIFSVCFSWLNLVSHIVELRREAAQRKVSTWLHLIDVFSAGLGALPYIGAIRGRRLESASYAGLPLVSKDIVALMAAVEDGATQAKALRARLASKVTSKIRSSPHSDEGLPSALGSLLSDGLKSLDLSDVGLGDDECALGKRVLVDFIRSRRLGALRHLAIDGNSLSKVDAASIGEAISSAISSVQQSKLESHPMSTFKSFDEGLLRTIVIDRRLLDLEILSNSETVDFRHLDATLASRASGIAMRGSIVGGPFGFVPPSGFVECGEKSIELSAAFIQRLRRPRVQSSEKSNFFMLCTRRNKNVSSTHISSAHDLDDRLLFVDHDITDVVEDIESECEASGQNHQLNMTEATRALGTTRIKNNPRHCLNFTCIDFRLQSQSKVAPEPHSPSITIFVEADDPGKISAKDPRRFQTNLQDADKQAKTSLRGEAWSSCEQALALAVLKSNKSLRKLVLAGVNLTAINGDARLLGVALRNCKSLLFLDMRGSQLDKHSKRIIADAFVPQEGNSQATFNGNENDTTKSMLTDATGCPMVMETTLGNALAGKLGKVSVPTVDSGRRSDNHKADSVLRPNSCGSLRYLAVDDWALLPGCLALSCDDAGMTDEDIMLLAAPLRNNTELEFLSLRNNRIREIGERTLADMLMSFNRTVTSVDLRGNVRSRAGQSLVEAALSPNSTVADVDGIPVLAIKSGSMTNVNLHQKWLDSEGWSVLVAALENAHSSVLSVDTSHSTMLPPSHNSAALRNEHSAVLKPQVISGNGSALNRQGRLPDKRRLLEREVPQLLASLLMHKSCALTSLNVDFSQGIHGDSLVSTLATSLAKNMALRKLSVRGLGLSVEGILALASALLAAAPDRAPLKHFAWDNWEIGEACTHVSLSHKNNPVENSYFNQTVISIVRLWKLRWEEVALIAALIGNNSSINTLEIDSSIIDIARPQDLSSFVDPLHGNCSIQNLSIVSSSNQNGSCLCGADLNIPHQTPRSCVRSSESGNMGSFNGVTSAANTPREPGSAINSLLRGLGNNASIKRLHLTVRPYDVAYDEVNTTAGWAEALGDALLSNMYNSQHGSVISSLNIAGIEELYIRGDFEMIASAMTHLRSNLAASPSLRKLELHLIGRTDEAPMAVESTMSLSATSSTQAVDAHPYPKNQTTNSKQTVATTSWLKAQSHVLRSSAGLLQQSSSIRSLAIQLLVPKLGFLGPPGNYGQLQFGFGAFAKIDQTFDTCQCCENAFDGTMIRELTFENSLAALRVSAGPSSHRSQESVALMVNGMTELTWMTEAESTFHLAQITSHYMGVITQDGKSTLRAPKEVTVNTNSSGSTVLRSVRNAAATLTGVRDYFAGKPPERNPDLSIKVEKLEADCWVDARKADDAQLLPLQEATASVIKENMSEVKTNDRIPPPLPPRPSNVT